MVIANRIAGLLQFRGAKKIIGLRTCLIDYAFWNAVTAYIYESRVLAGGKQCRGNRLRVAAITQRRDIDYRYEFWIGGFQVHLGNSIVRIRIVAHYIIIGRDSEPVQTAIDVIEVTNDLVGFENLAVIESGFAQADDI